MDLKSGPTMSGKDFNQSYTTCLSTEVHKRTIAKDRWMNSPFFFLFISKLQISSNLHVHTTLIATFSPSVFRIAK